MELKGRVALVTGAAVRIGRVIAQELAEAGADVVVHYFHHDDQAVEAVEELRRTGVRAMAVKADVAVADDVVGMFEEVERNFGPIDVLVNTPSPSSSPSS